MICPKCGKEIKDNYCLSCEIKITTYQKIKNTSAWLYNQGLQKAKVRDLTGAIDFLKRSLKFDKCNIDARNLLGLIYFEIGEVVMALEQWVISKNFKSEDNLAEEYINEVQENQSKLSKYNSAIKKYNQSLGYVGQNSPDLAMIQLKKVISINPNFVRAYTLLALLYMHQKEFEKAKKTLLKVLSIDKNNYTALRYFEELVEGDQAQPEEEWLAQEDRRETGGFRIKFLEQGSYGLQIAYIVLGIIIGAGLMYFLVTPGLVGSKDNTISDLREQIESIEEDYDSQRARLDSENEQLRQQVEQLESEVAKYSEQAGYLLAFESLAEGVEAYLLGDEMEAAEALYQIEEGSLLETPAYGIYQAIKEDTYDDVSGYYYFAGYSDYNNGRYESSIENMDLALRYGPDNTYTARAYYYKGRSHQFLGQDALAIEAFEMVVNHYPNASPYVGWATGFINELTN